MTPISTCRIYTLSLVNHDHASGTGYLHTAGRAFTFLVLMSVFLPSFHHIDKKPPIPLCYPLIGTPNRDTLRRSNAGAASHTEDFETFFDYDNRFPCLLPFLNTRVSHSL